MYSGKEEKYYGEMDAKSLLKLDDKKLIWAIWVREDSTRTERSEEVTWDPHMVFEMVYRFYFSVIEHPSLELDEIGMRFYFGGYFREVTVPYLSKCLDIIGAKDYKNLFDEFIDENNIDVYDLSKYAQTIENNYEKQAKIYDFKKTDEKFRKLTGIESCLAQYVRKNICSFAEESDFNMFANLGGSIMETLEKVLHSSQKTDVETFAATISDKDKKVMKEVKSCVNNTKKYFEANQKRFENKGIYEYFEKEPKELQWLTMIDVLCENGYALECNWTEKKKVFVSKLNGLKRAKILGVCVEHQWLDEEEMVENWVKVINDKWSEQGIGICSIGIENKCYLLGPYKVDKNTQADLTEQLNDEMDMANSYSMDEVMEYADSLKLYQNGLEKEYKKEALDAKTVAERIDETLNEVGNKLVLNFVFQGEGQYIKRLEQYVYQPWKGTMVIFHEKEGMALFYICRKKMDCYRLIHKCRPSLEIDIPVGNTELCSCVVHKNRKKLDQGIQQIFKNIKNVTEAISYTEEWCQEYPAGKKEFEKLCEKYGVSPT